MNQFLIALLQQLEPVALQALQALLAQLASHTQVAVDTHPANKPKS
jgi:predicted ATPase